LKKEAFQIFGWVARTTRCPGARSAQEAAKDARETEKLREVRESAAASCVATEESVAPPGQQVVRATQG
jgi:hypothetical protein